MSGPSVEDGLPENRGADRDDRAMALAFGALAVALLVRYLLTPWMGDSLPFVTVLGAVAVAVGLGGFRVAIVVVILGYLGAAYMLGPWPSGPLGFVELGGLAGLLVYLFTSALIIGFAETARTARRRDAHGRELLRVALQNVGDAVITTNVYGRIIAMNPAAQSLTGWSEPAALDQPLERVFRIADEPNRPAADHAAARNFSVMVRRDGMQREIDQRATPLLDEDGEVSGCLLVFRDITEQRRIEREREVQLTAARLLASIVEASTDAIVGKSLDGTIQTWNAAAESLFGYPAEAAIGRHISLVIPAERRAEEDAIIASISSGRAIEHFVTERVRSDGQRVLVSLTVSPIRNDRGHVIGASKIARDVTEQFAAAERERVLQAETARLNASLARADRRKNEFIATLAHELRGPVAAIVNSAHSIRLGGRDEGIRTTASRVIERHSAQLSRLVDDLLDVSRIGQGKLDVRKRRIELRPVVDQALESVGAYCSALQHEITVSVPPQPIYVDADSSRLAQIIGNLVHNACKFTDQGGHIAVTVSADHDEAIISVKDDGIGIPGEFLPRLFETFEQTKTAPERTRDGLGLGLPLVKSLVHLHGGTITVRSEGPGRGSEFIVRLPAVAAPAYWQIAQ
jgi:PAS domain S-box-containing protein